MIKAKMANPQVAPTKKNPEKDLKTREMIAKLEHAIKHTPGSLSADAFPIEHTFTDGLYARKIIVPAGMLIVTKLHKTEHLIFMLKGKVSVFSEQGGLEKCIQAPCMFISPAGAKRVVFIHEDTEWINVHANNDNTRDLEKLEHKIIAKNYSELGLTEPFVNVLEGGGI